MTAQTTNLTQLRATWETRKTRAPNNLAEQEAKNVLALIDTAEAAHDLADAADSVHVYPEGAVGLDDLSEAQRKVEATLARFTWNE